MHLTTFWFLTNLGKIFVAKLLQGCWGSKAESRLWYQEIAHGSFWRSFKRRRRRGRGISCLCIWERWHSNAQRLVVFWISIKPWKHTSAGHANSSTGIATYNRYFFSLFFPFLLLFFFYFSIAQKSIKTSGPDRINEIGQRQPTVSRGRG